ncbi:MAG: hypothetical protein KDC99_19375 [Cyclobacteriaceae bacterium]|nr:hypothetical protein [Cyclobacteriaceae bacterium]
MERLSTSALLSLSFSATTIILPLIYFLVRLIVDKILMVQLVIYLLICLLLLSVVRRRKYELYRGFRRLTIWNRPRFLFLALSLSYGLILSPYLLRNGYNELGGMDFFDMFATEGMWHANIVSSIRFDILPSTLHLNSTSEASYHYFSNLMVAMLADLSGTEDIMVLLIYVFVPWCLCTLMINLFALTHHLWKDWRMAILAVFLGMMCYDLSTFFSWLRGLMDGFLWFGSYQPNWKSNWSTNVTQFQLFHNPSYLMSTSLCIGILLATSLYDELRSKGLFFFTVVSWVFLFKAKITAYAVGMGSLLIFSTLRWWRQRDVGMILLWFNVVVFTLPFMVISLGSVKNSAEFSNWYFPNEFALKFKLISPATYASISQNGYPASLFEMIKFIGVAIIYYVGLFQIRLLAFFRKGWTNKIHQLVKSPDLHTLLVSFIVVGIAAFVFICNSLAKYDSQWFYLLIVFPMNIYLAERLMSWWKRTAQKRWIRLLIVLVVALPTTSFIMPCLMGTVTNRKLVLTKSQVEAMRTIRMDADQGRVLTPYYNLDSTDESRQWVGALSGKKVVSEGIGYIFEFRAGDKAFLEGVKKNRDLIGQLFDTSDPEVARNILNKTEAKYVYLEETKLIHFDTTGLLKIIYRQGNVMVLKVQ